MAPFWREAPVLLLTGCKAWGCLRIAAIFWHASAMQNMRYASQRRGQRTEVFTWLFQMLMNGYFAGMKILRSGAQRTEHHNLAAGAFKCSERSGHNIFMNCFMHLWSTGLPELSFNTSLFRKASCLHSQVMAMGRRYGWVSLQVTSLTCHKVKLTVKHKSEMPLDLDADLLWVLCMHQDPMQ